MEPARGIDLWAKVDYSLVSEPATSEAKSSEGSPAIDKQFWRYRRPVLDVIGTIFWVYAILKVCVTDVDRLLFGDLADYRFFGFLAGAALLAVMLRRPGPVAAGLVYVVAFPVVVLAWKFPKRLFKARSPVAVLAVANAASTFFGDLRRSILVTAVAAFVLLAISLSTADAILGTASLALAALVILGITRTVWMSVQPSRFMKLQQRAIKRVVDSPVSRGLTAPADDLRSSAVQKFDSNQQTSFLQSLGNAVLVHRAIEYWAIQSEAYRRGSAAIFLNGLSYVWLLGRTLTGISFLNFALYRADPSAFDFESSPSFLVFVRYAIAGLYGSEVDALHPVSDLANALSIVTFIIGLLVVGSLLVSSALGFRASREQSEIETVVAGIREHSAALDERVQRDFAVSVEEAEARLADLRFGLIGVIGYLSTRISAGRTQPQATGDPGER